MAFDDPGTWDMDEALRRVELTVRGQRSGDAWVRLIGAEAGHVILPLSVLTQACAEVAGLMAQRLDEEPTLLMIVSQLAPPASDAGARAAG